jgi:hypothetical protein
MRLARVWSKEQPFGAEIADITIEGGTLRASGVAIGTAGVPYWLEYQLITTGGYATSRLEASTRGAGWRRRLVLERAASGVWSCTTETAGDTGAWEGPGGYLSSVAGALDCDLGLSPLTNSMPVLRHGLHMGGEPVDLLMAWVGVPELTVSASRQRYSFVRRTPAGSVVRFESLDSDFAADVTFDANGIVLDYPGIARARPA